jgi:pimeloyl-ACP methyl ester carboxylesterase
MSKQIVVNNLLISYSEAQGSGAQTLLFLHGWRSNKEIWQGAMQKLGNWEIRKLAMDLPGFGGSQLPSKPMTVGDYADIVAEFIRKLGLKNTIIIGHSFGGRVAIKLSSVNPELVSKVVLVDSAGFVMETSKKTLTKAAAKIAKPFFKPKFMQPLRKKIYQTIGAEDYLATPELQKTFVNITGEDLSEDMKKIQAPTLIIFGENDKETPVTYGELMKFLIPSPKLLFLKGAGHFSFLDKPEEFINLLNDFVRS